MSTKFSNLARNLFSLLAIAGYLVFCIYVIGLLLEHWQRLDKQLQAYPMYYIEAVWSQEDTEHKSTITLSPYGELVDATIDFPLEGGGSGGIMNFENNSPYEVTLHTYWGDTHLNTYTLQPGDKISINLLE